MANRNAIDCVMNKDVAARVGITESSPLDQKLKALKGLKAAGTRPGAFTYLVLVDYAKRAGLVPQQDLQILGVGGGPSMIAALENGQIDVACNTSPTTDLMVKRGKAIMFTHNSIGKDPAYDDFLFELLYVRPDYAKANSDTVRAFSRALLAAIPAPHPDMAKRRPLLSEDALGIGAVQEGCRFAPRCPFAEDRCRRVDPLLLDLSHSRAVACHRAADGSLSDIGA